MNRNNDQSTMCRAHIVLPDTKPCTRLAAATTSAKANVMLCKPHLFKIALISNGIRPLKPREKVVTKTRRRTIRTNENDDLRATNTRLRQTIQELRDELAADRAPIPKNQTAAPVDGTVYFLRSGGYYKIGWTSDLAKRMRQYPPDTQLLAHHPGTRKDEAVLHKKFAHHRTHGREWYPLATQITEHINRMVEEHGEPDEVTFAARPTQVPRPHSDKPMVTPRNWTGGRHTA